MYLAWDLSGFHGIQMVLFAYICYIFCKVEHINSAMNSFMLLECSLGYCAVSAYNQPAVHNDKPVEKVKGNKYNNNGVSTAIS